MILFVFAKLDIGRCEPSGLTDQVEEIFDLEGKVIKVNTMIMPAKRGRRGRNTYIRSRAWKKAVVTLEEGVSIELFNV